MSRSRSTHTAVVSVLAAVSLTGLTGGLAPASTASPAATGAAPASSSGSASDSAPLLLINGTRVVVSQVSGQPALSYLRPVGGGRSGIGPATDLGCVSIISVQVPSDTAVPATALPFLGHGLDPSLFDVSALRQAEHQGRLPVTVHFRGQLRPLPGVTVTQRGSGVAQGYLTEASAPRFGAALARQATADRAHGGSGDTGLFAGGLSISLAGARAPAAPARPHFPMHILTLRGTNLAGQPDTGDAVYLTSASHAGFNWVLRFTIPAVFAHGLVKLAVPAGRYWVAGTFETARSIRIDAPAQVTVRGNTTVSLSAGAATSRVTMTTPRPAEMASTTFGLGMRFPQGNAALDCTTSGGGPVWVSPVPHQRITGTLHTATSATLVSPAGRGVPYTYALDFTSAGRIPAQHFTVSAGALARVQERLYSDTKFTGWWTSLGGPLSQLRHTGFIGVSVPLPMPGQHVLYLSTRPASVWQTGLFGGDAGQTDAWRLFHAGQHLTEDWNSYPLHPGPNVELPGAPIPVSETAARSQDVLYLDLYPFSDNTYGHTGAGLSPLTVIKPRGHYALYADGTRITSGNAVTASSGFGDLFVRAALPATPSRVTFTLTGSRQGPGSDLSGSATDTWAWPSRPSPAFTVQDMLMLGYQLSGEGMDGSTAAGPQSLGITVNHLQGITPYPVSHASLQVSFDHGTTWQPAILTRICHGQTCTSQFRARYTAPAGTQVSLRVTARDTHGATLTETILSAYQTA